MEPLEFGNQELSRLIENTGSDAAVAAAENTASGYCASSLAQFAAAESQSDLAESTWNSLPVRAVPALFPVAIGQ